MRFNGCWRHDLWKVDHSYMDNRISLLDIMRERLAQADAAVTIAERKAEILLGATSILVAIAGVLQLPNATANTASTAFLGIAVVLYVTLLLVSVKALYPVGYDYPVSTEWKEIHEWSAMSEGEYLSTLISEYADSIDSFFAVARKKANLVSVGFWLLGFIALFMVASAGFSAWS